MEKRLLIIQNVSRERPGFITHYLEELGIAFDRVDLQRGDKIPDVRQYDAMFVLGGPDSANDTTEKMQREIAVVKEWLLLDRPYLGICLGHQVLAKAAGADVVACPKKEIGFRNDLDELHTIRLTEEGRQDPLFRGILETEQTVFQLHGEMVKANDMIRILATGDNCPVQAIRIGERAYGVQFHFELTRAMLDIWLTEDPDLRTLPKEAVDEDFDRHAKEHLRFGMQLFTNFLTIAGFVPGTTTLYENTLSTYHQA